MNLDHAFYVTTPYLAVIGLQVLYDRLLPRYIAQRYQTAFNPRTIAIPDDSELATRIKTLAESVYLDLSFSLALVATGLFEVAYSLDSRFPSLAIPGVIVVAFALTTWNFLSTESSAWAKSRNGRTLAYVAMSVLYLLSITAESFPN